MNADLCQRLLSYLKKKNGGGRGEERKEAKKEKKIKANDRK